MAPPNEGQETTLLPSLPKRFEHHALFSYADEDKVYVKAVREALPKEVEIFDYQRDPFWGTELEKDIERKYKYEAPFCVVFISQFYLKSDFTKRELKVVSRVAKKKPGYMLPVVVDGTIVPEIEKLAWLDKRAVTPEYVAKRLVAKICSPPPKPWWFYISTEVKVGIAVALLALILAVYFLRPTRTRIQSVDVSEQTITAHLVKSGPFTKSAAIVGQRLQFGALPIEDAELRLDKPAVTLRNQKAHLTVLTLDPKCIDGHRPNNEEIEPLLASQPVTLVLDIRESDDAPGRSTPRTMTLPAARLKPFVRKWVAGNENPDC